MSSTSSAANEEMIAYAKAAVAATEPDSPETAKTYTSHCHCGAVKFTFGPIKPVEQLDTADCNCSICSERGLRIALIPTAKIQVVSPGEVTEYLFNKKMIKWTFCKVCGTTVYGGSDDPAMPMWGVNLRCVDGVDLTTLKLVDHKK